MPTLPRMTRDAIADTLREKRERHGVSYWVVLEPSMDAFAPVLSRVSVE